MSVVVSPNAPACTIYTMYVRRRLGRRVTLPAYTLRGVIDCCPSIGNDTFVDYSHRTDFWRIYTRDRNLDLVLRCYGITVQRIEEDNIAPGLRLMAGSEVHKLAYRRAKRSEVIRSLSEFIEASLEGSSSYCCFERLTQYEIDFNNGLTPSIEVRFNFSDLEHHMNSYTQHVLRFCHLISNESPKKI
ncbi:hypothetical protein [Methylobacterium oryzisoli]